MKDFEDEFKVRMGLPPYIRKDSLVIAEVIRLIGVVFRLEHGDKLFHRGYQSLFNDYSFLLVARKKVQGPYWKLSIWTADKQVGELDINMRFKVLNDFLYEPSDPLLYEDFQVLRDKLRQHTVLNELADIGASNVD